MPVPSREDTLTALGEWLSEREAITELVIAWPPGTKVTSRETEPLLIPAPGIVGEVVSWFEDGTVGVVAPMAESVASPITGARVERGQRIRGACDPAHLELLEYGEFTPDDVREAVAARRRDVGPD